jgi:glycosyltransferase involved in cell wall biosynthesis
MVVVVQAGRVFVTLLAGTTKILWVRALGSGPVKHWVIVMVSSILHLIPSLGGGGAERQLAMLAAEQRRLGLDVSVGTRRGGQYRESLDAAGVRVHTLGDHRGASLRLLRNIHTVVRSERPDVVQTWLPQMDVLGGIVALWSSVPWIVCERACEVEYRGFSLPLWFRTQLVGYSSAVVANSEGGAAYWRGEVGDAVSISVVRNAVDVGEIRQAAGCSPISHSDRNEDTKEILVVGRLVPEKAPEIIVEAARLVPLRQLVRVLFIGDGPLHEELEAHIRRAGLVQRVSVLPFERTWWGRLGGTCGLVSMSRGEGHPNVILEAMAAGCPIVASDIPAHREVLDTDTAILVPVDDPTALAQAIVSLLADPVSAHKRAQRAATRVNNLTVQGAVASYSAVYESVICRSGS